MNKPLLEVFSTKKPGDILNLTMDYAMLTDELTAEFTDNLPESVADPKKVVVLIGHDTPNSMVEVGALQRKLIRFAAKQETWLENCRGIGYLRMIEHYISHNQIVVGCGSHMASLGAVGALGIRISETQLKECIRTNELEITVPEVCHIVLTGKLPTACTVSDLAFTLLHMVAKDTLKNKLVVFSGDSLYRFTLSERYDLCHLMNQTGAYSALISDQKRNPTKTGDYQLMMDSIQQTVVPPGNMMQGKGMYQLPDIAVNEVFIGGCRGGKLEDLRAAANVVRGKHLATKVRMVVAPATSKIYVQAIQEGLIKKFLDCGAVVMNQGCSVCWGKAQGYLDDGEVLVSTGSYNYAGCSGSMKAMVYLASPQVAAQSAIRGKLVDGKQ